MKLLVHGATLGREDVRLAWAAAGLARRGHQVLWLGAQPAGLDAESRDKLHPVGGLRQLARGADARVEVVLGSTVAPVRTAVAGWLAGARVMGLDRRDGTPRWGWAGRYCFESLDAFEFVAPDSDDSGGDDAVSPERRFSWSGEPLGAAPDPEHPDCERLERVCERWLAQRNGPPSPAVFLDRDGTLVIEREYLAEADQIELLPGVPQALRMLRAAGLRLVVVSNQSGVGRGYFPKRRVYEAMARLRETLRRHDVELDAVYFCPHRPDEGCACRKPGTLLLTQAAENLNLALTASVMIGDKRLDAETGQNAKGVGVLVRTGYGAEEEARGPDSEHARRPDHVAASLEDAARWTLAWHADR